MKVIIAGSRTITDKRFVELAIKQANFNITEVVSGTARGPDRHGEVWAYMHGIPVTRFRPKWDEEGQRAGIKRNEHMAEYAEGLIAVWNGKSKGTKHMIWVAKKLSLLVYVLNVALPHTAPVLMLPTLTTGEEE